MMPLFLQTLMGYTASSAGLVLSGGGLLLLFLMPVVGELTTKVQARYIIAFGWLALSACHVLSPRRHLDLDISFRSQPVCDMVQVFGLAFLFVPINLVSYMGMPAEKSNGVAGIVNFMRNIGEQHRYVHGHHADCAPGAIPPGVPACGTLHRESPTFTQAVKALAAHLAVVGFGCLSSYEPGLRPGLPSVDRSGNYFGLYRHILGSMCRGRHHVSSVFCVEKKCAGRRGGGSFVAERGSLLLRVT